MTTAVPATAVPGAVVAVDEDLRLTECVREQIHLPGAVQPHGVLLVVDPASSEIIQASVNADAVLAASAARLLGTGIGALVGDDVAAALQRRSTTGAASGPDLFGARVGGRDFDVIVHRVGDLDVVEFEPRLPDSGARDHLPELHAAIQRLAVILDSVQLCRSAAREMRRLTGFDQVMVYRFHPDGHGEVIADDHDRGMDSYLGLHFPASDIPAQARQLYLQRGSGLIACTDNEPAALLPVDNPRTGAPLDLTRAELRSVSPHHLQFMRNMGQGSSFTLSLAQGGRLLGLITCAHRGPRRIAFRLRRTCEILAQQVTLQLSANDRQQELTRRLESQGIRSLLAEQMDAELDVPAGLTEQSLTLLDLIPADGAVISLHRRTTSVGHTPDPARTTALLVALARGSAEVAPLLTESLALDRPELAALLPEFAGLFVLPFGNPGDCLIWFRRQITQTVDWLGRQSADNRPTALSPRTSFEAWRQLVTDRCLPWDEIQVAEAAELCRDIERVLLRLAEVQMAHMALHDALTGLPNRRLLIDRITAALDRADRHGGQVAILFCDLDDFKRVNDTAGHAAGDAILVEAAARLSAVLRAGDSVARVGGDEFVIVLEPVGGSGVAEPEEPAIQISERIKAELTRPICYQDREHVISVSVGITYAAGGDRAEDVLRDADVAMYKAKQTGKNRVATFDDSLRAGIFARAAAEQALHTALVHGGPGHPRLTISYLPIVDVDSGSVVGFEAAPRLTDHTGTPVQPEIFSYVAEHTALIGALGETVLDSALAAFAGWRAANPQLPPARIGVNFSGRQAQHADLPALFGSALDRYGLCPSDLALEMTESVLIEAGSSTLRQLVELRRAGAGVAIRDFGAGRATLSQLALLPVDVIKIDRSFAQGLPGDVTNAKIVRALSGLAKDLGLFCIFTGIDEPEQLAALPSGVFAQGAALGPAGAPPPTDGRRGGGRPAV